MARVKLDRIDRHILQTLQTDGRVTNVKLARRWGYPRHRACAVCAPLEAAGYIRGYHADLNTEALGFGVTVFAQVGLESQAEHDLAAFEELVASWPMVRECFMLAGEVDFLLRVVATDWDAYQTFLTTELTAAPNVAQVKSALAIRPSKFEPAFP